MSIEGENRELLFQELYNMVGYHLAKYDRMPSLSFDDENPKSSDPTKHVVYDENEGKIVIHTGRFKMKREDILEKLRGFQCEICVDGQEESVKFDFSHTSKGDNSIAVGALEGFLTYGGRLQVSEERREKYYTEKKALLKDRNPEDSNERLEEQFNNIPNKVPKGNNNSVEDIKKRFGNPVTPQQPGQQPSGQQTQDDGWLTDRIPYNYCLQEEGIEKLSLGINPATGQQWQTGDVLAAVTNHAGKWESIEINGIPLRQAAQLGKQGGRPRMANNNFNNNFNNNMNNNFVMNGGMYNQNNNNPNMWNPNYNNQNNGMYNQNNNNPNMWNPNYNNQNIGMYNQNNNNPNMWNPNYNNQNNGMGNNYDMANQNIGGGNFNNQYNPNNLYNGNQNMNQGNYIGANAFNYQAQQPGYNAGFGLQNAMQQNFGQGQPGPYVGGNNA